MLEPPPWAGPLGVARILSDRQSVLLCILQSIFSGLNDLTLAAPPPGDQHTSGQMVIARASLGKDLRDQVRSGEERSVAGVHRAFDKRDTSAASSPSPSRYHPYPTGPVMSQGGDGPVPYSHASTG